MAVEALANKTETKPGYERYFMSAETYDALGRAISEHVLDEALEAADFVRDWVVVASTSSMDSDGETAEIVVFRSSTTPLYAVTGLLEWGKAAYGEVEL